MRCLFLCAVLLMGGRVHAERLPNIIYILADDLGYGDLSCLGQTRFETPHIDRLAREGMLFTQHYAGAPVCAPSRCALMTGKHTGHSVIRGNSEVIPEGQQWRKWQGKERPGFWIDMDMIPFGELQLMSPPSADVSKTVFDKGDIALAGKGVHRVCQLTKPQMETFITMRALAASPLMMGGDLPSLDDFALKLITDREMLACNQNGVMGSLVVDEGGAGNLARL